MTLLEQLPAALRVPHPVLKLPDEETLRKAARGGPAAQARLEQWLKDRAELVARAQEDPLNYGFEPESWRDLRGLIAQGFDLVYVTGANREGKSTFCPKFIMERMVREKCEVACFHNTETTSIRQQQLAFFKVLPPDLRARAISKPLNKPVNGQSQYLAFNEATGFRNQMLIMPGTGAKAYFFNYGQSSTVWEGPEYDIMYFEEGVTLPVLETSRFRRGRGRKLLLLVNFTPKWGFTPVVQNILAGAKVIETRPAPLLVPNVVHVKGCPPGHMPYIMHGLDGRSTIIFFHNGMNPMGAGEEIAKELTGAPKSRVMIRAYGWADKLAGGAFPKFSSAHLITRARFEEIAKRGGTRHLVVDPGGGHKNWFMQWWLCTPEGWHILYREWPPRASHEEWALSPGQNDGDDEEGRGRRGDWRPGPAQRLEAGRSQASYVTMILLLEGWQWVPAEAQDGMKGKDGRNGTKAGGGSAAATGRWDGSRAEKIARRIMDPRFGGVSDPHSDEGQTIIATLGQGGVMDAAGNIRPWTDADGRTAPPMEFEPAPGQVGAADDSLQMLADLMDWREHEPQTVENCPKLYVVEDCMQSRISFAEYVAPPFSTLKNALKDPVDCAKYYCKAGCGHEPAEMWVGRKGGYW